MKSDDKKKNTKAIEVDRQASSKPTTNNTHRVVVALIVTESIEVPSETSLWTLARHPDIIARIKIEGNLGYRARNEAFRQVSSIFGDNYSHILFVEGHCVFKVQDYEALRDAKKDLISGTYVNASSPYLPTYKPLSGNRMDLMPLVEAFREEKPGPIEVQEVGMDFSLVSKAVVDATKKEFHEGVQEWFWIERQENQLQSGENTIFCRNAKEAGFSTWLHSGVHIGKVSRQTVYVNRFLEFLREDNTQAREFVARMDQLKKEKDKAD